MEKLNLEYNDAVKLKLEQLKEIDEFHLTDYDSPSLYKEKIKSYHDHKIKEREFTTGELVLLFEFKLKWFSRKLRSRWKGPYIMVTTLPYGPIKGNNNKGLKFKVNGQRFKHYLEKLMR